MDNNYLNEHRICISDILCDPHDDILHWKILLKMASQGYADIIFDEEGEIRIWATETQLLLFMEADIDEFIDA
tara:strand:+ start:811 stop:1029 length:219 start_codon:yes stop_codon:yes gene_type:complete